MSIFSKLTLATTLLVSSVLAAHAQPGAEPVPTENVRMKQRLDPLATTEPWGGGIRLTGLSGIGALPGVNYGVELAAFLRRDELFGELAFGWWKPEHTYVVTEMPERVELKLDVWTLRAGYASMKMPIRIWGLAEIGELASARGMPGVVTRMMTGDTPDERQWHALGGGLGVAWPMATNARLFGMMEVAVPVDRQKVTLDAYGGYQPDPLVARASAGLEVGWR